MRTSGFASLAVVGVAAAVAVFALSYQPKGTSLQSNALTYEDMEYLKFVAKYGKNYATKEEFEFRGDLFKSTLAQISAENSNNENTFRVAINKFADWTPAEFKRILSYKPQYNHSRQTVAQANVEAIPDAIDWRQKGAVNAVKDQGQCGSCWAFSSVAAMEGRYQIKNGQLYSLAEQQLVDCAGLWYGNLGCNGGSMSGAFQYASESGMMQEADYPYTAQDGTCAYNKAKTVVTPTGGDQVATNNAQALKTAIAAGPVSVAIEADTFTFQFYSGGILNSKACGTTLDHGVAAVGYGVSATGQGYYIVRNSWGASWGDHGYVNIAIVDGAGICGIQMEPVFPTF